MQFKIGILCSICDVLQEGNPAVKEDLPILHHLLLHLLLLHPPTMPLIPLLLISYNTHTLNRTYFFVENHNLSYLNLKQQDSFQFNLGNRNTSLLLINKTISKFCLKLQEGPYIKGAGIAQFL